MAKERVDILFCSIVLQSLMAEDKLNPPYSDSTEPRMSSQVLRQVDMRLFGSVETEGGTCGPGPVVKRVEWSVSFFD